MLIFSAFFLSSRGWTNDSIVADEISLKVTWMASWEDFPSNKKKGVQEKKNLPSNSVLIL